MCDHPIEAIFHGEPEIQPSTETVLFHGDCMDCGAGLALTYGLEDVERRQK